jgi:hypothetical protein
VVTSNNVKETLFETTASSYPHPSMIYTLISLFVLPKNGSSFYQENLKHIPAVAYLVNLRMASMEARRYASSSMIHFFISTYNIVMVSTLQKMLQEIWLVKLKLLLRNCKNVVISNLNQRILLRDFVIRFVRQNTHEFFCIFHPSDRHTHHGITVTVNAKVTHSQLQVLGRKSFCNLFYPYARF